MDVKLAFIMSSNGKQVDELISDFPHNIPKSCFYGDEKRESYKFAKARYSIFHTLSMAELPSYLSQAVSVGILGAYYAFTLLKYRGPAEVSWQMGASVLLDDEKTYFMKSQKNPMDFGQPIEEVAKALGKEVTEDMHLDYNQSIKELTSNYPVVFWVNKTAPFLLLVFMFFIWKIFLM